MLGSRDTRKERMYGGRHVGVGITDGTAEHGVIIHDVGIMKEMDGVSKITTD